MTFELKKKEFSHEEHAKAREEISSVTSDVDGIFAKDYIVARVLHTASSRGICIPQELKTVGYDGTEIMEPIYSRLIMVRQNHAATSQSIVNALIHQIKQKGRIKEDMIHNTILLEDGMTLT